MGGTYIYEGASSGSSAIDGHQQVGIAGVMIGREAYHSPWMFADADRRYYQKQNPSYSRREVAERYLEYSLDCQQKGCFNSGTANIAKPLHNFFSDCDENRAYKRSLDAWLKKGLSDQGDASFVGRRGKIGSIRLDEMFWAAVSDAGIPSVFLDERPGVDAPDPAGW